MSTPMEIDHESEIEEDDDPVVAEYNVFITPGHQPEASCGGSNNFIYLLQFPNRARELSYNAEQNALPTELRVKPDSGFLELDIGVSPVANFDKLKGLEWGQAMKHARDAGVGGFGMSSGFGKGDHGTEVVVSGRRKKGGDDDSERALHEFREREARGGVLTKQTLGGQIKKVEQGTPYYMAGAFKGNDLHLTEIVGTVQMRPQFHHIDAQAQITRTTVARTTAAKAKAAEPRMAIQTQRSEPAEGDLSSSYKQAETFLQTAGDEQWSRLAYHDESDDTAFSLFDQTMFLENSVEAAHLESGFNNQQFLDAINRPMVAAPAPIRRVRTTARGGVRGGLAPPGARSGTAVSGARKGRPSTASASR